MKKFLSFAYKGYIGEALWDKDDKVYYGHLINIRDVVTFQGESADDARQAFIDSVDDYLDFLEEIGKGSL